RLIRSAPPKRTYSERTVAGGGSGSGTGIGLIVTERIDRNRDGPAPRKGRDAEPPARRDVAQEVDAQVDAREADQPRQEDPRHEQRRAAGEARAQAQRQRRGDPRVEHRVGRVPARERVAADRDELPGRARPRDRVLDQGDGQVDDRARADEDGALAPAPPQRQEDGREQGQRQRHGRRAEFGERLGGAGERARAQVVGDRERGVIARRRPRVGRHDRPVGDQREGADREGGQKRRELQAQAAGAQAGGDEAARGLEPARERQERARRRVRLEPLAKPAAVGGLAQEADGQDDGDDHRDRDPEDEAPLAGELRGAVEALRGEVADQGEGRRPEAGAEDAEGDELAVAHARAAGHERRQRPHEADEAADQDRLAAVVLEVGLDAGEALARDPERWAVAEHEVAPQPPPEQEARRVARPGADPDHRDRRHDRGLALAGDRPAEQDGGLAGQEQAQEGAGLDERGEAHDRVDPAAEARAHVVEDALEVQVRQLLREDHEARDDRRHDGDERALAPALAAAHEPPPPPAASPATSAAAKRGGSAAAARSAAGRSAKRPKAVGPEPATSALAAPARS